MMSSLRGEIPAELRRKQKYSVILRNFLI